MESDMKDPPKRKIMTETKNMAREVSLKKEESIEKDMKKEKGNKNMDQRNKKNR